MLRKLSLTLVASAAVALFAAPAQSFDFQGELEGDYNSWSLGAGGGLNGGAGTIDERYSWAGSVTENSGDMNFEYDSSSGPSGSFTAGSSASAGAGNFISTKGAGASNSYSLSGSGVIGGFEASVSGSGSFNP